jgi:hypothetical protein
VVSSLVPLYPLVRRHPIPDPVVVDELPENRGEYALYGISAL